MSERRCVLLFYEGYLGVSPSTLNLAKAFASTGYQVTIYTTPGSAPPVGDMGGVRIVVTQPSPFTQWLKGLGVGRFRVGRIARKLVPLAPLIAYSTRVLWKELPSVARRAHTVYVGIDMDAGLGALLCATVLRRRYVFLSLELPEWSPARRGGLQGALVRLAYRRSAAAMTQGQDRLAMMTRDFRWPHPTVFILPNSPFADRDDTNDDSFLRTRLAVPSNRRIALQAGMIEDTSCCLALARGFAGAGDWALVLHERMQRSPEDAYIAALRAANDDNLYVSLDPVPFDQVDKVFRSADIGLAFYQPRGPDDDDFRHISSSGKLPHYLKYGKPVLVSRLPALVQLVEEYDCGLVVDDPSNPTEIQTALRRISERYTELSRNAQRCFAERYDFGRAARPIIDFVAGL
jgi:glycosyltransferase involved in cell wall biosynthesis